MKYSQRNSNIISLSLIILYNYKKNINKLFSFKYYTIFEKYNICIIAWNYYINNINI